ncbi:MULTISPECIES: hypothetical protein [Actinomycetes]|uniref:hypothetical protein n=1 Tax=Actinomycetes TaxID=1760 RepID=UPI0033EF5EB5
MKCDEPMFRPGEGYSYRDCQLELGHAGAHDYLGEKMPRPVPSGDLDPEISSMLDRIAHERRIWDWDERDYTIVFEVTTVYAVEVTAESEDAALRQYEDLADLPDFDRHGTAIDGGVEVRRLDRYERNTVADCSPFGPQIACPGCGALAMQREWYHEPLRRCHGPIRWRETSASSLAWRWQRKFAAAPAHTPAGGAR